MTNWPIHFGCIPAFSRIINVTWAMDYWW